MKHRSRSATAEFLVSNIIGWLTKMFGYTMEGE